MTKLDKQREQMGLVAIQLLITKSDLWEKIKYKDIYQAHAILNNFKKIEEHKGSIKGKVAKYHPTSRWKINGNKYSCWRCSITGKNKHCKV